MKKIKFHQVSSSFIMLGMLALAALVFMACDIKGEEGEYTVNFENRSDYPITVNCPKGTPSNITLVAAQGGTAQAGGKATVMFTNSKDLSYIWTSDPPEAKTNGTVISKQVGLAVVFENDD